MNDIENSKQKIKNFLNENFGKISLKKQLEKLKSYDFSLLGEKQNCHEDSTDIMQAIYFLLWHNDLPNMRTFEEMDKNYGGETINTFNTLFQQELNGINKFISQEENPKLYEKIENFKTKYLTVGNFMILPNISVDNISINQKKGSYQFRYKDYFDLFSVALFHSDEFLNLKKANDFYFSKIDEEKFYKINFLDAYVKNNKFEILFKHEKYNGKYYPYYHWKYKKPKLHTTEYVNFAIDYINKVEKIIKNRADKICLKLEKIIGE